VFERFTKSNSEMHVELGMRTKHAMKGSETIPFHLESGGTLRVMNVLWVLELKRSVISISVIEKKGFDVEFEDGKEMINPRGYSSDKAILFGVRESKLYRLKGHPMQAVERSRVT
jgi:hypothetical protein